MNEGKQQRPRRAVILEPGATGHRPTYVRWIAKGFLASAIPVAVVGPSELLQHPDLAGLAAGNGATAARFVQIAAPETRAARNSRLALWHNERALRSWYGAAHRAASPQADTDLVIVPYLDNCFHAIAALGSPFAATEWCGITMRTEFPNSGERETTPARTALLARILAQKGLRTLWSIDPRSHAYAGDRGVDGGPKWHKLRYLPDPSDMAASQTRHDARRSLSLSDESNVVLLYGSIDPRKGLEELLRGAASLSNTRKWTIIIAGQQTAEGADIVSRWSARAHAIGFELRALASRIDSSLTATLFAAADVIWTGYPNHKGMSGVLVQAAFCGKPVIGHCSGLVGELLRSSGIGVSCDVNAPREVSAALESAVDPRLAELAQLNGPRFFMQHRPEEFGHRLASVLECQDAAATTACATQ